MLFRQNDRHALHEVYIPRIQRGKTCFAASVLGARGALLLVLIHFFEHGTRTRSLLVAVCLGLFDLMARTVQAGDTTEQPIMQFNEASDLIHWPEGFSPKQTDAFVHNQIFINAPDKVI